MRTDHAPANFTTIKHMAHNFLRTATTKDLMRLRRKSPLGMMTSFAGLIGPGRNPYPIPLGRPPHDVAPDRGPFQTQQRRRRPHGNTPAKWTGLIDHDHVSE